MKHITRWSPDTCDCVIDLEWDDQIESDKRTHEAKTIVKRCEAHSGTKAQVFNKVLSENKGKNEVLGELMKDPELVNEKIENNETIKELKPDVEWYYDDQRVLHVKLPKKLTKTKETSLKSEIESRQGVELVLE